MKLRIIALCGASGAGKSTLATAIEAAADLAPATCYVLRFKQPLLDAAERLNPRLFARYDALAGDERQAARGFLCKLGQALDQQFPGLIVEHMAAKLEQLAAAAASCETPTLLVIEDLRLPAELALLRDEWPAETLVVWVARDGNAFPRLALDGLLAASDADRVWRNDGTPDSVAREAAALVDEVFGN